MTIMAEGISEEQARQIAAEFWTPDDNGNGSSETRRAAMRSTAAAMQLAYKSEANELYVLNKPEGGWVIVAGDDTGSFDYEKAPDIAKIIIGGYAARVRKIYETRADLYSSHVGNRSGMISLVEPLLKTAWNQTTPYNNYCPIATDGAMDNCGGRCPSGCVPVAVAQIMNYWQWPKHGYGRHARYTDNLLVDFTESTYDWDNMLSTYTQDNYTEAQANAVAKLMSDIGVAANTQYLGHESGTNAIKVHEAMIKYFGYSQDMKSTSDMDWSRGKDLTELLKQELLEKRPVLADGQMYTGIGHAVVVDGCKVEEDVIINLTHYDLHYFHINFGWGGDSDAFYLDFDPHPDAEGYGPFRVWGPSLFFIRPSDLPRVEKDDVFFDIKNGEAQVVCCKEGSKEQDVSIVIPTSVEHEGKSYPVTGILPYAFHQFSRVADLTLPGSIKKIPAFTFALYDYLHSSSSSIGGSNSFNGNFVKRVRFNEGLEEIGDSAFFGCEEMDSFLSFPSTLRRIGSGAFSGTRVGSAKFNGKGFVIEDYGFYRLEEGAIDGLEYALKIGENGIIKLRGDFIISPVCQYAKNAVSGKFDHIILPASLTNYDPNIFGDGARTAEFVVRKGNPNYASANGLLLNKDMTTLIAYPCYEFASSTRDIIVRDLAFVPAGVKTISRRAFAPGPTLITIPASVKELDGAFTDCTTMRELTVMSTTPPAINDDNTFPDNINDEYRPCKLIVPHGSKAAYQQANGWKNFENIIESDLYVQGQLCYTVSGDQWATIEGRNADADFDGNLFIPATVTIEGVNRQIDDINLNAFTGDLQLKTVTFSKNLESWAQFTGCDKLYAIHVEEGNSLIHSTDGMLFANIGSDQRYTLVFCPPMKQEGSSIVERSQVVIPDGTQHIVADAFTPTLRRVTIPASVEEIEENAFGKCNHLKTIICKGTNPPCFNEGDSPFPTNLYLTATLYIPKGSLDNYKQGWPYGMFSNFENIVEYDPATFDPNSIDDGPEDAEPADPEFPDPNDYPIDEPDEPGEPDEPVIQDAVAVYRINGQVEYFAFDGRPTITYEGDNLVMTCGGNCVQYTLKGLEKITFTTIATGIGNLPELKQLTFSFSDDRIDIAGAKADEPVRIYDTTGRMVDILYTDGEGRQTISFSPMQKGVYIIQIGNTSYKILKK